MASVVVNGDTSGAVTLSAPAVAGTVTVTLPAASGTMATLTTPSFATTIGVGAATPSASGAGITFPATQSASSNANTLDDYEEGTWTPTLFGTSLGTVTYTSQDGKYTKIGRVVYLTCRVAWSNITNVGSGDNRIQGLPFSSGTSQTNGGATFYTSDGIATNPALAGLFYDTEIYLRNSANILASTNLSQAYNNSGSFAFNGYYFV